jgi:acetyltransferase
VALRNLNVLATPAPGRRRHAPPPHAEAASFAEEISACEGPLPAALGARILAAYGIPMVRSALVRSEAEALAAASRIGFPLVAKIASPDVPHRSELGGVVLGIENAAALCAALTRMRESVLAARPAARIDGFELQEQLTSCVEAAAGFIAAPPFGALVMVGGGGVLTELEVDRAVELASFPSARAREMIASTKLGRRLSGYRGLLPPTDLAGLSDLLARLSIVAAELGGIAECDLNPVLVHTGSGDARVVDTLMVAGRACS